VGDPAQRILPKQEPLRRHSCRSCDAACLKFGRPRHAYRYRSRRRTRGAVRGLTPFSVNVDTNVNVIKAGLNLRFGPGVR
jgi:hypothetical protein